MNRLWQIEFWCIRVSFTIVILIYGLSSQPNRTFEYINIFEKVALNENLPKPFIKLDSIFYHFYENEYPILIKNGTQAQYIKNIDQQTLINMAKILVWINYLPDEYAYEYWSKSNKNFDEQRLREKTYIQRGKDFNETLLIKPGGLQRHFVNAIYDKLDWEWKFHLENKYILIVRIIDIKNGTPLNPDRPIPFYTCELIQDIKGNFNEINDFYLIGNFVKGIMELDSEYLVLLHCKNASGMDLLDKQYLLRGLSTENEAFFKIQDGKILDPNLKLGFSKNEKKLEEYKKSIEYFLHHIVEVPYNE